MRQRFLLLFHPRSGSNLIAGTLGSHPAVVMYGELFNHIDAARHASSPGETTGECGQTEYFKEGSDPVAFLQTQLYERDFPPEKTGVGFKLSQFHMRSADNVRLCRLVGIPEGQSDAPLLVAEEHLWNWLRDERDIRVISLHRRSLLQTLVSGLHAIKSKQWWLPVGASQSPAARERVSVPAEMFREFVDLMEACRQRARDQFADHPVLDLEYQEDVVERFDATIQRIEAFLGLPPLAAQPIIEKQARQPIGEAVANYAELCAAVAGSRYEAYL